jgi:hypothetical protein
VNCKILSALYVYQYFDFWPIASPALILSRIEEPTQSFMPSYKSLKINIFLGKKFGDHSLNFDKATKESRAFVWEPLLFHVSSVAQGYFLLAQINQSASAWQDLACPLIETFDTSYNQPHSAVEKSYENLITKISKNYRI